MMRVLFTGAAALLLAVVAASWSRGPAPETPVPDVGLPEPAPVVTSAPVVEEPPPKTPSQTPIVVPARAAFVPDPDLGAEPDAPAAAMDSPDATLAAAPGFVDPDRSAVWVQRLLALYEVVRE